jgi:hypothetical protein
MTQTAQQLRLTNNFEPAAIALVREMEDDGWTGRISNRGHAILRSPDGAATCSVQPRIGDPRNKHNVGASYRRWKRAQEAANSPAEPGTVPEGSCPTCGKDGFASPGRVHTHMAHAHRRMPCPVCAKQTSPAQSARHLASHYREPVSIGQLQRDLSRAREEITRLREELVTWQQLAQEAIDLL